MLCGLFALNWWNGFWLVEYLLRMGKSALDWERKVSIERGLRKLFALILITQIYNINTAEIGNVYNERGARSELKRIKLL